MPIAVRSASSASPSSPAVVPAAADVIVVNTHLYGLDVASGGVILPEHDVVVFDEAHGLEDIMSDTVGVTIAPWPVRRPRRGRAPDPRGPSPARLGGGTGRSCSATPSDHSSGNACRRRCRDAVREFLGEARTRLGRIGEALSAIDTQIEDAKQRKLRAQTMTGRLIEQLETAIAAHDGYVDFVSGSPDARGSRSRRSTSARRCRTGCGASHVAILTSATIPASLAERVGLPADGTDVADVGSPFDYPSERAPVLRDGTSPTRGRRSSARRSHEELAALITAAGGRTLALFTSWRAMDEAAAAVRATVPYTILTQRDLPKPALVRAFAADAETCLFATAGLFQGVDVPGSTLSLVVIDRIPFPGPTIHCCRRAASSSARRHSGRSTYHGQRCCWRRRAVA